MASPEAQCTRTPARGWKACESCRKKKTKCDGQLPSCSHCASRNLLCLYLDANDNAARSRQDAANLTMQYDRLDSLYDRMEQMITQLSTADGMYRQMDQMLIRLSTAVEALGQAPVVAVSDQSQIAVATARQLSSAPEARRNSSGGDPEHGESSTIGSEELLPTRSLAEQSSLIPDANNIHRYIGGYNNKLLVSVMQTVDATASTFNQAQSASLARSLYGVNDARPETQASAVDFTAPPRYLSDVLVSLFLTRLNSMFPILQETTFTNLYREYLNQYNPDHAASPFRALLFGVYACASNMLAIPLRNQNSNTGNEYFQRALLDNFQTSGYGGIAEVQCLVILSVYTASCNRLTEAWKFAGQAIRAAQDLGLHVDFQAGVNQDHTRSRVWWCVNTLDSLLSACLGRPTASFEMDHDCPYPEVTESVPMTTTTLVSTPSEPMSESPPLTGFVAVSQACRILDRISRLPQRSTRNTQDDSGGETWLGDDQVIALETQLSEWVRDIPSPIKYAANNPEDHGGVNLALCTLTFLLHAVAVINLNLPLIGEWEISDRMLNSQEVGSGSPLFKVITAARGVIRGSELVGANIPPSHYLAFCVHLIYVSGFILLKAFQESHLAQAADEVEACVNRLSGLEAVYPGAKQRSEVLQELLNNSHALGTRIEPS